MEVGVKERSKKKLVRRTWAGRVKKWEMKNWQREQIYRKWRGNGGEEDRNCDGVCIKHDLEMGDEWKKMIDRRNWRLLTENVVREK